MAVDASWLDSFMAAEDYDGDGAKKLLHGGADCNDNNASVYPEAVEICDDGVDNDCDGRADDRDADCAPAPLGMAFVPSGCFEMGDTRNSCAFEDECPVHNVCFSSDFYMDAYEVTNFQYAACVKHGACTPPSSPDSYTRSPYYGDPTYDNYPVVNVDWNQASAYCTWQGKRLPTEAEWEYAARGGLSGKSYALGDSMSCSDGNNMGCIGDTNKVQSYPANGYGLYDMDGNVWEWVNDWYDIYYYKLSPANDPQGPPSGMMHISRGGCWSCDKYYSRLSFRNYFLPDEEHNHLGFRCVKD